MVVHSSGNDRLYLRGNNIVMVSSIVVDGLLGFEERNYGNLMEWMPLNEKENRRDSSIVSVGTNVGKQSAYQLEPFPSSVITKECDRGGNFDRDVV